MIFHKKIIFFWKEKISPKLRFPYSFWVQGCQERSSIVYFQIFRVTGTQESLISIGFQVMENLDFHDFATWKIAKLAILRRSQRPQTRKLSGKRSIDIILLSRKNNVIFMKNIFSQYFPIFRLFKTASFVVLAVWRCHCPYTVFYTENLLKSNPDRSQKKLISQGKMSENREIFFSHFQLRYYQEKIARHSESPRVTHQSPSKIFRIQKCTSDCSRSAGRVTWSRACNASWIQGVASV